LKAIRNIFSDSEARKMSCLTGFSCFPLNERTNQFHIAVNQRHGFTIGRVHENIIKYYAV
jgi:hypothetical protein